MALKIEKLDSMKPHGLKILLHAESGVGKTSSIATLKGSTLLLNAENGVLVLKGLEGSENIDILNIKNLKDISDVYKAIKSGEIKYDNYVLDSLSEIGESVFKSIEDDETIDKAFGGLYTAFKKKMISLIKAFRDIEGANVILIALSEQVDVNGMVMMMPSLPHKKTQSSIMALFDECLYMTSDDSGERKIFTTKTAMHMAKSRSKLPKVITTIDFNKIYNLDGKQKPIEEIEQDKNKQGK